MILEGACRGRRFREKSESLLKFVPRSITSNRKNLFLLSYFMKSSCPFTLAFSAAALLSSISFVSADDWPAYRGPAGSGVSAEALIVKDYSKSGPSAVWKAETPLGFSSFSVADGKALTLVARDIDGNPMEVCVALNAETGKTLWEAPLWISDYKAGGGNAGEQGNDGGDGPRSTPTVDGDQVFVLDAH